MDKRFAKINIYDNITVFEPTPYTYKELFFNSFCEEFYDYSYDLSEYEALKDYVPKTTEEKITELIKCAKDPLYFIYKYATIVANPEKGGVQRFHLYDYQAWFIKNQLLKNPKNVVLKSRQLGFTTVVAAYLAWNMIFIPSTNVSLFSSTKDKSKEFLKKIRIILTRLPKFFYETYSLDGKEAKPIVKFTKDGKNVTKLRLDNFSEASALAMTADAGVSATNAIIVIDEAAICDLKKPKVFQEVWQGLLPTITTGGRAIILSTPRGMAGIYHRICSEAKIAPDESDFKLSIFPWYVDKNRDFNWFIHEYNALRVVAEREGMDVKRVMAQEHLCSFEASGETVLDNNVIDFYEKNYVKSPLRKEYANLWVWELPKPGEAYCIFTDVAEGGAADFSAFHIFKTNAKEQVAEYMSKSIKTRELADLLIEYSQKYNNAIVSVESNSYGIAVIEKMIEMKFDNLVCHEKSKYDKFFLYKDIKNSKDKDKVFKVGIYTSTKSRPLFIGAWCESIRNKEIIIHSSRSIEQWKTFVWNGKKAIAMSGFNDDLILSNSQYSLLANQLLILRKQQGEKPLICFASTSTQNSGKILSEADFMWEQFKRDLEK